MKVKSNERRKTFDKSDKCFVLFLLFLLSLTLLFGVFHEYFNNDFFRLAGASLLITSVILEIIVGAKWQVEITEGSSTLAVKKTGKIRSKGLPSKFSLFIAAALHNPEDREFIIDNIEERFAKDIKKHGIRWAKWMLWRDNLVGLWAAVGAKTIKGLKWLGFGYLIEKFLIK